jgi:hypothetical protein
MVQWGLEAAAPMQDTNKKCIDLQPATLTYNTTPRNLIGHEDANDASIEKFRAGWALWGTSRHWSQTASTWNSMMDA